MKKIIIIIAIILAISAGGAYFIRGRGDAGGQSGRGTDAALGIKVDNKTTVVKSGAEPAAIAEIVKYQYTETYSHPAGDFSFKYPKDFAVSELPGGASEVILVQNIAKNIGAQIVISPFAGGEININSEYIKAEIPDLKVSEPQAVLVGQNRQGLAFMSDNEAFGGASREVWFVFNGQFYQISTYAELDGFLKGLFGTWEFLNRN